MDKEKIDFVEITKFVLGYALHRSTYNTLYFEVNENYNIYECSEVDIRSKNTNKYLYLLFYGRPKGDVGETMIILYKYNRDGRKEIFSMDYESLLLFMNKK